MESDFEITHKKILLLRQAEVLRMTSRKESLTFIFNKKRIKLPNEKEKEPIKIFTNEHVFIF